MSSFNKVVGNLEATLFGKNFQMKLFPEVVICLLIALTASGMVHRICTTVWLVPFFSFITAYISNKYIHIIFLVWYFHWSIYTTSTWFHKRHTTSSTPKQPMFKLFQTRKESKIYVHKYIDEVYLWKSILCLSILRPKRDSAHKILPPLDYQSRRTILLKCCNCSDYFFSPLVAKVVYC